MEAYRYKAINAQGRVTQGRVDAVNPADLETRLARMGLDLVNFKQMIGDAKELDVKMRDYVNANADKAFDELKQEEQKRAK